MIGKAKKTVVKEFRGRWAMQRSISRMAGKGYRVQHQSGEFSHGLRLPRNRRRVVVTFERGES